MAWEALKKIAINFAVVFIIASVFASIAPGTAQKAFAFFGDKLGFGEPSIGYFTVAVDGKANTQFLVKYSILGNNYGDIEKVVVSRSYGESPDVKIQDRFPLKCQLKDYNDKKCDVLTLDGGIGVLDFLGRDKGEISGKVKIEDGKNNVGLAGVHRFTLEVFLSSGDVDSKDAEIMIYDDAYVELFKGGLSECVTKGIGADPVNLYECDVDAEKRDSLSALSSGVGATRVDDVIAAYNNAPIDKTRCKYESSGFLILAKHWLSDECAPEEVDKVWQGYLKIIVKKYSMGSFSDNYDCKKPFGGKTLNVCKVKRQVVMTLNGLGWKDLRKNKGWEANV